MCFCSADFHSLNSTKHLRFASFHVVSHSIFSSAVFQINRAMFSRSFGPGDGGKPLEKEPGDGKPPPDSRYMNFECCK